jgi:hypothetical protein
MFISPKQNTGQNHNIRVGNKSLESVPNSVFGMTPTNQNYVHEEVKSRLY